MSGYGMNKGELSARMARIEGPVRGISRIIEGDRYCIDVLTQISAVTRALQGVALGLFDDHLRHCVAEAVEQDGPEADEKLTEATAAVARLVRT